MFFPWENKTLASQTICSCLLPDRLVGSLVQLNSTTIWRRVWLVLRWLLVGWLAGWFRLMLWSFFFGSVGGFYGFSWLAALSSWRSTMCPTHPTFRMSSLPLPYPFLIYFVSILSIWTSMSSSQSPKSETCIEGVQQLSTKSPTIAH